LQYLYGEKIAKYRINPIFLAFSKSIRLGNSQISDKSPIFDFSRTKLYIKDHSNEFPFGIQAAICVGTDWLFSAFMPFQGKN
jgi:hypothetical protein